MQRERDELVDAPYRRDFLTYDNHILDGEMFLQVWTGARTMTSDKNTIIIAILLLNWSQDHNIE